jgi:GTPase SAR1 family protein
VPFQLPAETALDGCSTFLIDSDGSISKEAENEKKIKFANSILLMYDMSNGESVEKIESYWLPLIERMNSRAPVILVGSKLDLVRKDLDVGYYTRIQKILRPMMKKFRQVEIGIECSSKDNKNIIQTLYCAQSSCKYPIKPLINMIDRTLTEEYKKALTRIFRIHDEDNDGRLDDLELSNLQHRVFEADMTEEDFRGIRDVIREDVSSSLGYCTYCVGP